MVIDQSRNKLVKMGIQLGCLVKERLKEFLKSNTNIMAYNVTKILGVNLSSMVYHLNVREDYKLVKQRKPSFALDR